MTAYYLGLDPSSSSTGYCVMNDKYIPIEYGKIVSKSKMPPEDILFEQYNQIEALIHKYEIKHILCEDQFFGANADTLKKLSRVTGVYLLLSKQNCCNIKLIYPTSWRKVFHGSGSAKKEDTFRKVQTIYKLDEFNFKKHNDITDAIGIAHVCVSQEVL